MVAATLTVGESWAEMVLGIVGVFTAFGVILSPWSKFSEIKTTQEVGQTKAYPYLAIIFNSAIWVIFAIPAINKLVQELLHHQHPGITEYLGLPLLIANGAGVFVELWYIYIFFRYAVGQRTAPAVILSTVIVVPLVVLALMLHLKCSRTFVGYIAMFSGAAMYAIPVYGTIRAYKANDLTEISVYQASASLANGVVWTAYSCIHPVRAFVFVPNFTAILCAGGQLIARRYLKRKIARQTEAQRREVELAKARAEREARAGRERDLESGGAGSGSGSGHVQITEEQQDEEAKNRAPVDDLGLGDGTGEAQRAAELAEAERAQRERDLESGPANVGVGAGSSGKAQRRAAESRDAPQGTELRAVDGGDGAGNGGSGSGLGRADSGAAGGGSGDVQMTERVAATTGGCVDAKGNGGAGAHDGEIQPADANAVPVLGAGHGHNNNVENHGQEGDDDDDNNAGSNVDDGAEAE